MFFLSFNDISPLVSGKSNATFPNGKHHTAIEISQSNTRWSKQNITILYLWIFCLLFYGCEKIPTSDEVSIRYQKDYVALKSFPLTFKIYNVESGFIRIYSVKDETLSEAGTFYGRKHRFLINSSFDDFKIVRVNQKDIIKYKYIRFKSYVYFNEVKPNSKETSVISNNKFLETDLTPGRYLLVPWKEHSPAEPIGYGFVIQSTATRTPLKESKSSSPKKSP